MTALTHKRLLFFLVIFLSGGDKRCYDLMKGRGGGEAPAVGFIYVIGEG